MFSCGETSRIHKNSQHQSVPVEVATYLKQRARFWLVVLMIDVIMNSDVDWGWLQVLSQDITFTPVCDESDC